MLQRNPEPVLKPAQKRPRNPTRKKARTPALLPLRQLPPQRHPELSAPAAPSTAAPAAPSSGSKASSKKSSTPTQAQTPPQPGMVRVNTDTGVYHKSGRWYGKTKNGKWMTEEDAIKAGYKDAKKGG